MTQATVREDAIFPHLVKGPFAGGEWQVQHCRTEDAGTNPRERMVRVPDAILKQDVLAQMHELEHIRRARIAAPHYARGFQPGMRGVFRRMCEEIAVERGAFDRGLNIYEARDCLDWINNPLPTDRHDVAAQWLQVAGSIPYTLSGDLRAYFAYLENKLAPDDKAFLRGCLADLEREYSHVNCERWADDLVARFAPPMNDPGKPQSESGEARKKRQEAEAEKKELEDAKEKAERRHDASNESQDDADWEPDQKGDDGSGLKDQDGQALRLRPLDIHKHTANADTTKVVSTVWRAADSGSYVRYPRNLIPSGRVFGVKSRGGSILVDTSSSMAWDDALLERLIRNMPGVWVAVYDGHTNHKYSGRLCVVAQKGKVSKRGSEVERSRVNAGSGADLAALQYAMKFAPKPCIWVSDGGVGYEWEPEVTKAMKRGGIKRVLTVGDAIDYLTGKTVMGCRTSDVYEEASKIRK